MKKRSKIKLLLLILLSVAFVAYLVDFLHNAMNEVSVNHIKFEENMPFSYQNIFNTKTQKKIVYRGGRSAKSGLTVAAFTYDNKYDLEMKSIHIKNDFYITSGIIEIYNKPDGISPNFYMPFTENGFKIIYDPKSNDVVSKIYLTLIGNKTHTYMKNDSIACYYSYLRHAAVQFKPKGVYNVSIDANGRFLFFDTGKPAVIMFLKRDNMLYFITMMSNADNLKPDPGILSEMIKRT